MSRSEWFLLPQPKSNADLKIICFPYAGGNASTFIPWVNWLPDNVELIAIQPPGRASRILEPAYLDMDALVKDLLKDFSQVIDRPYILFGHSLGSRIAFELMVQYQKEGGPLPSHFIASGSRGPHIPSSKGETYLLPDKEFIAELRDLNGTPKMVFENEELMELCLPLLRADFELASTYVYSSDAVFASPISVLSGQNDSDISYADSQSWGNFFSLPADVHIFPGDHFFIESDKQLVMQTINEIIQKVIFNLNLNKQRTF